MAASGNGDGGARLVAEDPGDREILDKGVDEPEAASLAEGEIVDAVKGYMIGDIVSGEAILDITGRYTVNTIGGSGTAGVIERFAPCIAQVVRETVAKGLFQSNLQ